MKRIILASKSPRRIEMLSKYWNDLIIFAPDVTEIVNPNDKPQTTVMKIAFEKADGVYNICDKKGLIIAADTVVYLNRILGKPKSYDEGFQTLKELSGKVHKVFTGLCIWDNSTGIKIIDYEETSVEFNNLDDELIIKYLNTGEYEDKAGSYGIQGYGELFVKRINGCYNNVKGLPLTKLNTLLKKHFALTLL